MNEYEIEKVIDDQSNNTFSIQAAIDPHLFRGISDIFKNNKNFYSQCHIEIMEQSIKKQVDEE